MLMSRWLQGRLDQSLWDEDLTSGLASLALRFSYSPRLGISADCLASIWQRLLLN